MENFAVSSGGKTRAVLTELLERSMWSNQTQLKISEMFCGHTLADIFMWKFKSLEKPNTVEKEIKTGGHYFISNSWYNYINQIIVVLVPRQTYKSTEPNVESWNKPTYVQPEGYF